MFLFRGCDQPGAVLFVGFDVDGWAADRVAWLFEHAADRVEIFTDCDDDALEFEV